MSILPKKIREFFYERSLEKELASRSEAKGLKSITLENAKRVGILFDATDLNIRNSILDYVESLKDRRKTVKILGYFNNRLKDNNFTFRHYNRDNIDWAMRPKGEDVEDFIKQDFDLLINLSPISTKDTEYITAAVRAELKIGPITDNTSCYDLMLDSKRDVDIKHFISQVEALLKKTTT